MSKPYIVIDSDNYAASGIETLFFPGGEPHAKVPHFDKPVLFVAKCRTWNDTGIAACVRDAIMRQWSVPCVMFLPYFPGARQDRSDGSAPLTVYMIDFLFGGSATPLHTFDLHNPNVLEVTHNWMPSDVPDWCGLGTVMGVIAPDAGATERAENFRKWFAPTAQLIQCTKERDPKTGRLSNYQFPDVELPPGRYMVVDDICDGGGTFNLLASAWENAVCGYDCDYEYKKNPPYRLELFVSHGIFSKGIDAVSPIYSKIYTTDSWFGWDRTHTMTEPRARRLEVRPLAGLYDLIMKEYL